MHIAHIIVKSINSSPGSESKTIIIKTIVFVVVERTPLQ